MKCSPENNEKGTSPLKAKWIKMEQCQNDQIIPNVDARAERQKRIFATTIAKFKIETSAKENVWAMMAKFELEMSINCTFSRPNSQIENRY